MRLEEQESLFFKLKESNSSFTLQNNKKDHTLEDYIKENKGILISTEKINEETIIKLKRTISKLQKLGYDLTGKLIAIEMESDQYLTSKELEFLIEIEQYLQDQDSNLVLKAEDLFSLNEIIETNDKLQSEIDYINSLTVSSENNRPLNQLEKFIMVYDFCTNFKYNEHENELYKSRYITSILNGNNIVCVGYSKLLKEMCSRLGIECYSVGLNCFDTKTQQREGHQNNIVVLDGKLYCADACWDCQREDCKGLKFYNHCLFPMEDCEHIAGCKIQYTDYNVLPYAEEYLNKARDYLAKLNNNDELLEDCKSFLTIFDNIVGDVEIDHGLKDVNALSFKQIVSETTRKQSIKKLEKLIIYLKNHQNGDPISLTDFKKSLYNTYTAKGMSEKSAKVLLERTIKHNIKRAKHCFTSEANNCFSAGEINELVI